MSNNFWKTQHDELSLDYADLERRMYVMQEVVAMMRALLMGTQSKDESTAMTFLWESMIVAANCALKEAQP